MRSRPRVAAAALLAGVVALGGCRSSEPVTSFPDDPGGAPADFSLDLTAVSRTRAERFILFPDGALHWGARPEAVARWMPPYRRTLERGQVDDMWRTLVGLGLIEPDAGMEVDSGARIEPGPNQTVYVAVIGGGGVRWSVITRQDDPDHADAPPALARVAERLGDLAWATLLPSLNGGVPKRYDFGPDPYEQYRP